MKLLYTIVVLFFISFNGLNAQVDSVYTGNDKPEKNIKKKSETADKKTPEKFTWGGDFQAWIGRSTFILLSPTVGFIPYKNFNMALGLVYNYTSYAGYYGVYSQSIFGGHSFLRYTIAESYFVQVQFDKLRQPNLLSLDPDDKIWVDYVLIGGGFRQSIGDKAALTTSIMYNINPDPLSIYFSRVIVQFGITGRF